MVWDMAEEARRTRAGRVERELLGVACRRGGMVRIVEACREQDEGGTSCLSRIDELDEAKGCARCFSIQFGKPESKLLCSSR